MVTLLGTENTLYMPSGPREVVEDTSNEFSIRNVGFRSMKTSKSGHLLLLFYDDEGSSKITENQCHFFADQCLSTMGGGFVDVDNAFCCFSFSTPNSVYTF